IDIRRTPRTRRGKGSGGGAVTTDFAPPLRDLSEAEWEALAMDTLGELGWKPVEGKAIAPGSGERESWSELILPGRLRDAIARINPQLPPSAVEDALMEVTSARSRDALAENRRIH